MISDKELLKAPGAEVSSPRAQAKKQNFTLAIIRRVLKSVCRPIGAFRRETFRRYKSRQLTNKTPSIICNNCIGGIIYRDLFLKFNSPTINLFFSREDFICYVNHLEDYSKCELVEDKAERRNYPVGILSNEYGEVRLYFMHYRSFPEAKEKWDERTKRIDINNIFVIMEAGVDCPEQTCTGFNSIKFKNKILLTDGVEKRVPSSFPMSFYDDTHYPAKILDYPTVLSKKRFLDEFDYTTFLNTGRIEPQRHAAVMS